MEDISICKKIIEQKNCFNFSCSSCPLRVEKFNCDLYLNVAEAAKAYIAENNTFHPKKGEKVLVRDYEGGKWRERIFLVEYNGKYYCTLDGDEVVSILPWKLCKQNNKQSKWKWVYEGKNKETLISDYYIEAEAKEYLGEKAVKIPFTETV